MWTNGRLLSGKNLPGKIRISRREESPVSPAASEAATSGRGRDEFYVSDEEQENEEYVTSGGNRWNGDAPKTHAKAEVDLLSDRVESFYISPSESDNYYRGNRSSVAGEEEGRANDTARVARFRKVLSSPSVDLDSLRELAWSGVPYDMRPVVWRLLLGYAPASSERRDSVLNRKRSEYRDWVRQYYEISNEDRTDDEIHTLRQICVDVPRTVPEVTFFQQSTVQTSLERILYIWAIRHPASGYVQGINDLVTPFLTVFLSEIFPGKLETWAVSRLPPDLIFRVEADCYWCLSKLLAGIQDHYTFAQPGIQRMVFKLKELVTRIDEPVASHIEEQGLEFLQFAFRWFNCLLIREVPFSLVARLWDTYLAEGDSFSEYLVYVCAGFLLTWTDQLRSLDFQEMVLFLQHVPTRQWTFKELETVLSKAFMWRVMFNRSPNHFTSA